MKQKIMIAISLAIMLLMPPLAKSTVLEKLDLNDLVKKSKYIIIGDVESIEYRMNDEQTLIETFASILIKQKIKGDIQKQSITVVYPGGTIDNLSLRVPGTPDFIINERAIIFLKEFNSKGMTKVVGWHQGRFKIKASLIERKGVSVEEFIEEIRSINQ